MERKFLEALGLDKEKIDSIMAEHGKTVEGQKTKVTDLTTSLGDLKTQLTQRDKDLQDLKKQAEGNAELKTKFDALEKQYKDDKEALEVKIKDTQLSSALKLALAGKVHDADLVVGLIDKTKIELGEDGNVSKGLDEQIKTLQGSKSFLFVSETKASGIKGATPGAGQSGDPGAKTSIGENFAKTLNQKNQPAASENNPWG